MLKIEPFQFNYESNAAKVLKLKHQLHFEKNGVVLISGKSGTGKSTFLSLIKGIIPEFTGGHLSGNVIEYQKENRDQMVYLFQNPFSQVIHADPVFEFAFTMENLKIEKDVFYKKKKEYEAKMNLEHIWSKETSMLSNGECQKLVLASMLSVSPKIILLDEPTAFLDPESRKEFYQILRGIKNTHLIFLVDHHLSEIKEIVDRTIFIDERGEIEEIGKDVLPELMGSSGANMLSLPMSRSSNQITLYLQDVEFKYPGQKKLIGPISTYFRTGEVTVLKGRNGSGKSTLLKILAGLLRNYEGKIELKENEKFMSLKKLKKLVGFAFQNPENNFFYDSLEEEFARKVEWNGEFNTEEELKRSPYLFSEGQKRRISLLINFSLEKQIFLIDEPTFGQDLENIEKIEHVIRSLSAANKMVIIISHDEQFISRVANRVLELKDGSIFETKL